VTEVPRHAGLTARERDVTLLAAAGLTSRTIAYRLRISVRTVDNYLGRVYQKLGVAGRHDLARWTAESTEEGVQ
jgi:DNA-binding CsgD family transcriptional regulator